MNFSSYYIYTFGCAMNEYDTERIAAGLERRGLVQSSTAESADVIILNTCSVREKPYIKISSYLGKIRKARRKLPNILIGITGCVAQQDGKVLLKKFKIVNFVMGTEALSRIDDILEKAFMGKRFVDTALDTALFTIDGFERKKSVKAHVTIMKGCENFCSYCIVPFVRGREASRSSDEIVDEVKRLIDVGIREVCLLGQNVNSYGRNLAENIDFSDLLRKVHKIDGLKRIRFMTSHPKDFSEKMINTIAECEKICKFIHLPLQSGSDKILEAMNRGYTFKEYASKIDLTKKLIPEVVFSSDFIVGFPNETEADFENTLDALKYVGYDQIFAFNYSPRPMTAAADFQDDVPDEIKSARLIRLFEMQNIIYGKKLDSLSGSVLSLLVSGKSGLEQGVYSGLNVADKVIKFRSERLITAGEIVKVKVCKTDRNSLFGQEV